jgi:hypothetical protein
VRGQPVPQLATPGLLLTLMDRADALTATFSRRCTRSRTWMRPCLTWRSAVSLRPVPPGRCFRSAFAGLPSIEPGRGFRPVSGGLPPILLGGGFLTAQHARLPGLLTIPPSGHRTRPKTSSTTGKLSRQSRRKTRRAWP